MAGSKSIYQLKITLKSSKPPIWRRILVEDSTTLDVLHYIIQTAMGWYDCHLHSFSIHGREFGIPQPEFDFNVNDERKCKLNKLALSEKEKFRYDYDFGDGWDHIITLEKILPADPKAKYPVCTAGKLACPPEDCGGLWGYYHMLEVLSDKNHEEYEDMTEWMDHDFDPESFSLEEVNLRLKNTSK